MSDQPIPSKKSLFDIFCHPPRNGNHTQVSLFVAAASMVIVQTWLALASRENKKKRKQGKDGFDSEEFISIQ